MSRAYPERPLIGVGVVVCKGDQVLLVRRAKAPRRGQWSLPGGAQKLGETVRQAAIREVREETGLEVALTYAPRRGGLDQPRRGRARALPLHPRRLRRRVARR